ncbi:ankyrin repeat domain-containing protein 12 isoform X1 [Sipha flava]|uniref:Ankyrin repeat domain-containing protein 12 isoform X1 n=3 Tax=Sipha flava TaxID=143950 RepID=A0A8B8GS41_9HEMI|nr:ankyrin repeat domain-containing protein 12 isoform X1 [Sipha flava]
MLYVFIVHAAVPFPPTLPHQGCDRPFVPSIFRPNPSSTDGDAAANSDKQQQHASPRVTLRLTNTGNNQFKSSSARLDEKNKKIAEEQNTSMTNDTKTVEAEEKSETPSQSVSQSTNASTSAPAESTSTSSSKEAEVKDAGSGDAIDTTNNSSNELNVKGAKDTDNLKRPLAEEEEEVKPKKRKEEHSQSSKGKTESSSPKPDSDEDKSGGSGPSNADSPGSGPKVPPLKIVIPTTDADTGTRTNGKNGNRSHHHTALPYVVPSEESPPASNQPNSPKSPQKASSDTLTVEEQKSPQTRVLRSSNRCGSNSSGAPSRGTSPIVPEEQLAPTTSPPTVVVDTGSNPSPSTRSEQTENVSVTVTGDDKQAASTAAATATTSESTATADMSALELHPRRRKLKASRTESETSDTSSVANVTAVETNPSGTTNEPVPVTNCYQMFLNIRKQIDKRRKNLFPVQPKPPSGFKDYLMNRCTYVLAGNSNSRVVNTQTPSPANLHEQLKKLFVEQEKERQRLRVQHIVEKEKLVLSVEQEILRVHGRAARALANQLLPFSVCTILKDEEVYNIMTPEQEEEKDRHARSRYNGRLFLSWLQDVDDKWEKIKESMLLRHHNEAESLHAVQKMDWGWKLKELQLCTYSSEPNIDEEHVPMVLVSDDFDLLPA